MHTADQKLKDEAIAILEKYGSIEYVKKFSARIVQKSWREVDALLPRSEAKEKLSAFAKFLIERKL
jgi:geranylgeranyl pyrophosphate synthase